MDNTYQDIDLILKHLYSLASNRSNRFCWKQCAPVSFTKELFITMKSNGNIFCVISQTIAIARQPFANATNTEL